MQLGETEKKKKRQECENERRARIEQERARHELTRLVMGTIILVLVHTKKIQGVSSLAL